jgi:hypothetical protein
LGFDPSKSSNTDDKIEDDEGELLDMDEFLNTYGKVDVSINFLNLIY